MLAAYDIAKNFGSTSALTNCSVQLHPGTITAVIGPTGSGKTTLIRALSLVDPPDRGRLVLDDVQFRFPEDRAIVRANAPWPLVTLVFQQLFLWPHLTLKQNIMLPLRGLKPHETKKRFDEVTQSLGLTRFVDRYPNHVSGGQRQLVALARAIALRPRYLLLDEITSALDIERIKLVLEHLQRLRDGGVAIVLVTHLIGFAQQAADQVVFLADGNLVEAGGRDILESPKTDRLAVFLALLG